MIKINNPLLESAIKNLDFNTQMQINTKYMEMLNHVGEKNIEKVERLLSGYIFHYLLNGNFIIDALTSSNHFLSKVSTMTNAELEGYINLCTKANFGFLLTNKTLLKNYSAEDHLRICEIHIAYHEHSFLSSVIELAAKHKAKPFYIQKIADIVNFKMKDPIANELLTKEDFYAIKSDFERLIILEHITKTDDVYEKSLYKDLASNKVFIKNNDIYYLVGLVENFMKLRIQALSDQLIREINDTPSITQVYSPEDLFVIMKRIYDIPRVKKFFFHPYILANFQAKDIERIYNIALSNIPESIDQLIEKLKKYKEANVNVIKALQQRFRITHETKIMSMKNQDITDISYGAHPKNEEPSNPPASLAYKISSDGQWIDA